MEELITLLTQFNDILKLQLESFHEFVHILDMEEHAITLYQFAEIEKSVVLKDQQTKVSQSYEEKRIRCLKKICYLMAFDSRGQNLSLPLFKTVFSTYVENVKKLLTPEIIEKLELLKNEFFQLSDDFTQSFENMSLRINRNQAILKKVLRHVNLSINLFQSEASSGTNYDSLGKSQSIFNQKNPASSIRVTV